MLFNSPKRFLLLMLAISAVLFGFTSCNKTGTGGGGGGGPLGRPLRVGVVTWPGYAGGIVANGGFKPNPDSIFNKQEVLKKDGVEFLLMEDVDVRNKAFAKGGADGVDIVWSTVDFWANELPAFVKDNVKARAIMQVDWSRGGDAIVVDPSITKVEDLKGKKVSLAQFTPSHWLLATALQNSSLDESEQKDIMNNIVGRPASPDARVDFVAKKVDAAVVWEPDVTEALQKRPGAKVLYSTKTADNLIADIMVAREDFIKEHPDVIKAFIQGWFEGTAEANRNPSQAVKVLMENEPLYKELGEQTTREGLTTVKWADLKDNTKMFGLDGGEPLFDGIFKNASQEWLKYGYITAPVSPEQSKDISFLKEIFAANPVPRDPDRVLPVASGDVLTKGGATTRPVDILFPSGSSDLTADAKQVIDTDVKLLAETNTNAYIRVEGNTDSDGPRPVNIAISKARAQKVVDYLVAQYKFNPNRFIVVGNGPDKPRVPNTSPENKGKNRRTDVVVVATK